MLAIDGTDLYEPGEVDEAGTLATELGADHLRLLSSELEDEGFLANPPERLGVRLPSLSFRNRPMSDIGVPHANAAELDDAVARALSRPSD